MVLLYYLSQNPAFAESVKPLMGKIKDSEQMLNFLNDLSKFSSAFGNFTYNQTSTKTDTEKSATSKDGKNADASKDEGAWKSGEARSVSEEEKSPQSPTAGIADEFIQNILDSYLKRK